MLYRRTSQTAVAYASMVTQVQIIQPLDGSLGWIHCGIDCHSSEHCVRSCCRTASWSTAQYMRFQQNYNPILSFVQYGLYTAFAGPIIYAVFGSVKQITMGPTAVMALMTFQYTSKGGAPYAIVLSFLAGCLEFIAGVLNLGKCLHFFSNVLLELYFLKCFLFFYRFPSWLYIWTCHFWFLLCSSSDSYIFSNQSHARPQISRFILYQSHSRHHNKLERC